MSVHHAIQLGHLRRYLYAHGWTRVSSAREIDLFRNDRVELFLPESEGYVQKDKLISAALDTLAALANVAVDEIATSVRGIGYDLILARLPDALVFRDSIQLRVAENFIRSARKLLKMAASTELQPTPFLLGVDKEGEAYAERCRFGHTFRGSFGFTVESPIGPNSGLLSESDVPPPFERLVVYRLMRGFRTIQVAAQNEDPDVITKSYNVGFNADMCDGLLNMATSSGTDRIDFDFVLSPEWRPTEFDSKVTFTLESRAIPVLQEAYHTLRRKNVDLTRTIIAPVVRLESKENPADLLTPRGTREVVLRWDSEDFGNINVRIRVSPEDYLKAVAAHRSGQMIAATGTLDRQVRGWVLSDVTGFEAYRPVV